MTSVTGTTRLFGILADPIRHVRTPQRLNEYFLKIGFDGVLVPIHVHPDSLEGVVGGLRGMANLGGVVVTIPHKQAIVSLCDDVSPVARQIGAANVVRREREGHLTAHMLDGTGFIGALAATGVAVQGKAVYMAGAGGVASAIAFALVEAGASTLTVANRTKSKAQQLKERVLALYPHARINIGSSDPSGHAIVVNATSLGLDPSDPLPLDVSRLDAGQLVCEVVMQPRETPLLQAARKRGCSVQYGEAMLTSQVELIAQYLGVPPAARS